MTTKQLLKKASDIFTQPGNTIKALGLIILAIVIVTLGLGFLEDLVEPMVERGGFLAQKNSVMMFDRDDGYYGEEVAMDMMASSRAPSPSIPPRMPEPDTGVSGSDAEDYEVKEYNASIRTGDAEEVCGVIADLKKREDVIFENANEYERGCNYTFKVEKSVTEEVLAIIEDLDPDDVSESTYTIKRIIENATNELDLLAEKLKAIDETFESAKEAYEELEELSRSTKDAESLASVIDSKVQMIERLTQQRINIVAQIDRLKRSAAEQLDRLNYTRFNVNIREDKFIDGRDITDSWKNAVQEFVRDANTVLQGVTIHAIIVTLLILQYVLYFFILLFIVKKGWGIAKRVWES